MMMGARLWKFVMLISMLYDFRAMCSRPRFVYYLCCNGSARFSESRLSVCL